VPEASNSNSLKKGLLIAGGCLIVFAAIYMGVSNRPETPQPPAGSSYYKGTMAGDLISQAHDPRNKAHKAANAPPVNNK